FLEHHLRLRELVRRHPAGELLFDVLGDVRTCRLGEQGANALRRRLELCAPGLGGLWRVRLPSRGLARREDAIDSIEEPLVIRRALLRRFTLCDLLAAPLRITGERLRADRAEPLALIRRTWEWQYHVRGR